LLRESHPYGKRFEQHRAPQTMGWVGSVHPTLREEMLQESDASELETHRFAWHV